MPGVIFTGSLVTVWSYLSHVMVMKHVYLRTDDTRRTRLAGFHHFTEIGQIFQKTQNRGTYNFREWNLKTFAGEHASRLPQIRRSDSSKPVKFFPGSVPGSGAVLHNYDQLPNIVKYSRTQIPLCLMGDLGMRLVQGFFSDIS